MIAIGYALIHLASGAEVQSTRSLPWRVNLPGVGVCDFDRVGQVMPDADAPTHKVVLRVLANDPPSGAFDIVGEAVAFDGTQAVVTRSYQSLPEPRRMIEKSVILERITDAQLTAALAMMTPRQIERWRMPGHPSLYVDDPELLGLLAAVGADPATVLAE